MKKERGVLNTMGGRSRATTDTNVHYRDVTGIKKYLLVSDRVLLSVYIKSGFPHTKSGIAKEN